MFAHTHKPSIVNCGPSVPINGRVMIENEGIKRILYISPWKTFLGLYLTKDMSEFWVSEILGTK